jgi:predicted DNA-binding transcriptional regulator AlpA
MASSRTKREEPVGAQDAQSLLRCDEVAELLRIGEDTLSLWRRLGKGPRFIRYGLRCVRYRRAEVFAWVSEQEVRLQPPGGVRPRARGEVGHR